MLPLYITRESHKEGTENSRVKHQIFESNRLENILFHLQTGLFIVDTNYKIEWVNPKVRIFFPEKDPEGLTCCQLMHAVKNPCQNCPVKESFLTGKIKKTLKFHPKVHSWFFILSQPVPNTSGEIVKVIQSVTDITLQKVTEINFQKMENHFHSIMNTAKNFVIYRLAIDVNDSLNLKVVYFSPSAENILGVSDLEEFESWVKKVQSKDVKRILENYRNSQTNVSLDKEYRVFNPQKNLWRWIHTVSTVEIDENTQTLYLNGVMLDTTEKHDLRNELYKNQEHTKSIMDNATGFVIYRMKLDEKEPYELKMVDVSPSVEEILGVKPENFNACSYYDNLHPDDVTRIMKDHEKALQSGRFEATARVFNSTFGDYRWIHSVSVIVDSDEGRGPYINGLLLDVTERHEAFEKLKQREKDLSYHAEKLAEMNSALNVLVKKREQDKTDLEKSIVQNIHAVLFPEIEALKTARTTRRQSDLIDTIESTLQEISSSFLSKSPIDTAGLSSSELKVANYIRQGKSSKEIAAYLNISLKTVKNHRVAIRKKFGITGKRIGLQEYISAQ